VPIRPDGSAGEPAVIAELPDTDPDGVSLDAEGNYWITLYRPDGLLRVSADGRSVDVAVDDHLARTFDAPTNIAWVGERLDRAVVANVGGTHLLIGDLGVLGAPPHLPLVD
jgi:sugar lactone lactonase YvrE